MSLKLLCNPIDWQVSTSYREHLNPRYINRLLSLLFEFKGHFVTDIALCWLGGDISNIVLQIIQIEHTCLSTETNDEILSNEDHAFLPCLELSTKLRQVSNEESWVWVL